MIRILFLTLVFFLNFSFSNAEKIKVIEINGNERVSSETIKVFSKVKIGNVLNDDSLDKIIKDLYSTNFFKNITLGFVEGKLSINVIENPLVQNVEINGVKNKDLNKAISDQLIIKEKNSYVEEIVTNDLEKTSNLLKLSGYYFSTIDVSIKENNNNTVTLIYDINLGEKALVSKINFTGNKIYKKNILSRIIVTEENRFWKFLSKKKYLNENQINLDRRLLKNFYLNEGYYQVNVTQSTASIIKDNNFMVTYNIEAGKKYFFDNVELIIPTDYDISNFKDIENELNDLKNTEYSLKKIESLLDKIDKIAVTKQFEFINASFEEKVLENKINIKFIIDETQKLYVNRVNIVGNSITNENVIRNFLVVDEGDPLNEILNNKSISKIKSSGLFSKVDFQIKDTNIDYKKDIQINVVEQPTGEITAGAGYGSSGQTLSFGIKESNFGGNATKLNSNLSISEDTLKGGLTLDIPNYRYSDKALKLNLSRTDNDFFDTAGYKNTVSNFTLGTGFEYKQDLFFNPLLSLEFEDLETNSNASTTLKKQDGNYNNLKLDYNLFYDKRNQSFRPSEGFFSNFSQKIPILSNSYSLYNKYDFKIYKKLSENMIGSFSYHLSAVKSLDDDDDVRVSERLSLSPKKLRGFKKGKIGPKDNNDYIGGNYVTAMTASTTLPDFLPDLDSVDFSLFLDAGNVWGVDYDSSLDNSKLRSSTGLSIDWLTPIGPLNFIFSQPITKSSTDVEETFRFDIGTTF